MLSELITGQQIATAAATALPAEAVATAITVLAPKTNTGVVFVGSNKLSTDNGFPLDPGRSVNVYVSDASEVFIFGTVAGDKVAYLSKQAASGGPVPPPPPPVLPAPQYNQAMGITDASGFVAQLPFQGGAATQVWFDTANGQAAYNGYSPYPGYQMNGTGAHFQIGASGRGAADPAYGPAIDIATVLNHASLTTEVGNQFFFAEGQTFKLDALTRGMGWGSYHGNGAAYPSCWQSYDNADPLNIAKHGRAGTAGRGARPVWLPGTGTLPGIGRGDFYDYGGWAFRGIHFVGGDGAGQGVPGPFLWENCIFEAVELFPQGPINVAWIDPAKDTNIIRFCAFHGQYASDNSHACGIFSFGANLTIEDNVLWHCGWPEAMDATRDAVTPGRPDIFKHALYIHGGFGTWVTQRRNVIVDSSAGGFSNRGNHLTYHNVLIDNPTPDYNGGGSSTERESPTGVTGITYAQLMLGGADIDPGNPRGVGYMAKNHTVGSVYAYSLAAQNPLYGHVNNRWLETGGDGADGLPSFLSAHDNAAYHYAPIPANGLNGNSGIVIDASTPLSPIEYFLTDCHDNVNRQTASPMSTTLSAEGIMYQPLLTAINQPSKAALIKAMIADPSQPWAYRLLRGAAAAFNWNFNHTLPVIQAMQLNFMSTTQVYNGNTGAVVTKDTATTTSSVWYFKGLASFIQPVHNAGPNLVYIKVGRGDQVATTADVALPVGATMEVNIGRTDWTFTDPAFPTQAWNNGFAAVTVDGPTTLSFPPLLSSVQYTGFPGGQFAPPAVTYHQSSPIMVTDADGAQHAVTGAAFDYRSDGSGLCKGLLLTAANSAKMIGASFTNWWQAAKSGTLVILGDGPAAGTHTVCQLDDGTQDNRITCQTIEDAVWWTVVVAGIMQVNLKAGTCSAGVPFLTGFTFQDHGFAATVNGGALSVASSGTVPGGLTQAVLGNDQAGNALDGHVAFMSFVPQAASAALQGATRLLA